jgi:formiminotetrahydrofolate cyclodeaminase
MQRRLKEYDHLLAMGMCSVEEHGKYREELLARAAEDAGAAVPLDTLLNNLNMFELSEQILSYFKLKIA